MVSTTPSASNPPRDPVGPEDGAIRDHLVLNHPEPRLFDLRDPARSRSELERLGKLSWELALDWLFDEGLRRPVGPDSYSDSRSRFFGTRAGPGPAPLGPVNAVDVFDEVRERLLPYQFSAHHPRSFSYFTPPPLPMSIAAGVLSTWWQQSVDIWQIGPTAAFVEEEIITWMVNLVGYGLEGWGVLTSGGVMANLMAFAVARDIHLPRLTGCLDARGGALDRVRVYASDQAHFSVARSLAILGFPSDVLHIVSSDDRLRLRGDAVVGAVSSDRADGLVPLAIVGVAGSTNTGSVDRIDELADVAQAEGLWFHVDAAYGGAARFSERHCDRIGPIERADSITMDPHKWFYQPHGIGGLMVKDGSHLRRTFHRAPEYYRSNRPQDEPLNWFEYSMEGTRPFRALGLWLSWKHLGTRGFGSLVDANIQLASYLKSRCEDDPEFEVAPGRPELSIVCFRHVPAGWNPASDPASLDRYQNELQRALEESGDAWVSTTVLRGRLYLRAGIINYMSTRSDVDQMLETIVRLAPGVWARMINGDHGDEAGPASGRASTAGSSPPVRA